MLPMKTAWAETSFQRVWVLETAIMDTNTLLIIVVIIFLFGGFGWYGRGRWF